MTNYRVVNKVHHSLEDSGFHSWIPRRTSDLVWEGEHYPSREELNSQAQKVMDTFIIRGDYGDIFHDETLRIQQQRVSKLLGWKTLQAVGIKEFITSDTLDLTAFPVFPSDKLDIET
jgi:hypothetical protein